MNLLASKTGCIFKAATLKGHFRALEKIGLAAGDEQWDASRLKDVVRGAHEMPDTGKGLQLLNLVVACDPSEANESKKRGWNAAMAGVAEQIEILRIHNRWIKPTSAGWSDAQIMFRFRDDPTKHICEIQLVHVDMMLVRQKVRSTSSSFFYCFVFLCFGV